MTISVYSIIQTFLNIVLFIATVINAAVWLDWFIERKYRIKGNYAVGPLLFSLHALIFLLATNFGLLSYEIYFIWRTIVTIHAIILFISYGVIMKRKIRGVEKL